MTMNEIMPLQGRENKEISRVKKEIPVDVFARTPIVRW